MRVVNMLVETDLRTKSTAGQDEMALDMLIAEAAASANPPGASLARP